MMTVGGGAEHRQSLVARTGQTWKVYVFLVLLVGGGVAFALMIFALNSLEVSRWLPDSGTLSTVTVVAGLVAFAWLWFSLRCPDCGQAIAPRVIQEEAASSWWRTLLTMSRCPNCGSRCKEGS
jgi:hypothetical protein